MRKDRFTAEQIMGILKQSEAGKTTKDICREHSINPNTFYTWKEKYGCIEVADAQRLRAWRTRTESSNSWWLI